jgi:hypothetical protein
MGFGHARNYTLKRIEVQRAVRRNACRNVLKTLVAYNENNTIPGEAHMSQMKNLVAKRSTIGDSAVDGLFGGLGAGIIMGIYFVAAGLIGGEGPALVLSRFDPSAAASPLTGALVHLAVASVYGMLFAIGHRYAHIDRLPTWLDGLLYGVALLLLAEVIILPGAQSALRAIPVPSFGLAHVIYGVMLGILVGQVKEQT